jgi:transposase
MLLRHYLDEGLSKSEIARKLGISRDTIHRLIRTGQLDRDLDEAPVRYGPRPAVATKLEPYQAIIVARLEAYPLLSAVRLFEEVKAAGYGGGYTQLKEFVRSVRPCAAPEPVVRFETPPGHQAQVDFAEFRFPWGKRYALVVVLGYSRLLWLRFYARQDMRTLFAGLEEAFAFFGGVPRELLFDQMKAVITRDLRLQGGQLVINAEFLRFASHWGFRARACQPYRAQTKGKVERPIRYVRENFVYGREFLGDAHLDEERSRWQAGTANVRIHATTKEPPTERFEREERDVLLPLAERSYRSLVLLSPVPIPAPKGLPAPDTPPVSTASCMEVERRPLSTYDRIAAGAA